MTVSRLWDLWVGWWRRHYAHGDVIAVRWADDVIVGFEYEQDARRFLDELRGRLAKDGLELHPDKMRLIEFGRYAARDRRRRGLGESETLWPRLPRTTTAKQFMPDSQPLLGRSEKSVQSNECGLAVNADRGEMTIFCRANSALNLMR